MNIRPIKALVIDLVIVHLLAEVEFVNPAIPVVHEIAPALIVCSSVR